VHDDRNDREQNQQVNEEAADVKDEEATDPKNQKDYCEYEKHGTFFLTFGTALARADTT